MLSIAKYSLILAAPLLMMGTPRAAEHSGYSGDFTASLAQKEASPIDAQGRVIVSEVLKGTNKNTGREDFMDGAQLMYSETLALNQGNGLQSGTITFIKDGKAMSSSYVGAIKTVMVDGKPHTTGEGTWKSLPGEAMIGSGTYHFAMTSPTELTGGWEGHLESTAAR